MAMQKSAPKNENIHTVFYMLLIVALMAILIVMLPGETKEPEKPTLEQQVLAKLAQYPEVKPFAGFESTIEYLTTDKLNRLKNEQPVIYGDVPSNIYQVEYKGLESGLLVLYDFENDEILKTYAVQEIVI